MQSKAIQIEIKGKAGAGKSTLAFAIQKMLNEAGVNCEVQNEDCVEQKEYYTFNLSSLAGREVIITQTQISHH